MSQEISNFGPEKSGPLFCYNELMDKKLRNYIKYIEKESAHPTAELIDYHKTMTQQFQHERLIHLIVTFFFALFMIIFFILFLALMLMLPNDIYSGIMKGCTGVVTLIFLVTVIFYVRHYYQLENGTQVLEDITRKLYKRDK